MMLNAQKTISLFFKTADFERAFGRFLANHSRGIAFISGFELFFHQGVDAFSIFTGFDVIDEMALRDVLSRTRCRKDNA